MTQRRPHIVGVRLTDTEMAAVQAEADRTGLTPAAVLRTAFLARSELDQIRQRLDALEGKPPARDPASTTAATTAIATPANVTGRRRETGPVRAFGFGQEGPA